MGRGIRLCGLAATVVLALGMARPVGAQTTATTGITITTQDAGAFVVEFAALEGGYAFVNASGGTTFSVSATTGDVATATVKLAWSDSRVDEVRTAYTIALSAADLTSGVERPDHIGTYTIPAGHLAIVQIGEAAQAPPLVLDTPQTVFASGTAPAAGDGSVDIAIRLDVPPSSYPTSYTTRLLVQVSFGGDGP